MLNKVPQIKSKKTIISLLVTLSLTTSANIVLAEELKLDSDKKLPDFLSQERKLSEKDLKKKKPFTKKQLIERAGRSNQDYHNGKFETQEELEIESQSW